MKWRLKEAMLIVYCTYYRKSLVKELLSLVYWRLKFGIIKRKHASVTTLFKKSLYIFAFNKFLFSPERYNYEQNMQQRKSDHCNFSLMLWVEINNWNVQFNGDLYSHWVCILVVYHTEQSALKRTGFFCQDVND